MLLQTYDLNHGKSWKVSEVEHFVCIPLNVSMETEQQHDLELQQTNSLKHWVQIHTGTGTQQIVDALRGWMTQNTGPVTSPTAWIGVLKHAYDIFLPIHDEVNGLFAEYYRLAKTPPDLSGLMDPVVYPQSENQNREMLPPEVPLFDLAVLVKASINRLQGRVIHLVQAKGIKVAMRERLNEAIGVLQANMEQR